MFLASAAGWAVAVSWLTAAPPLGPADSDLSLTSGGRAHHPIATKSKAAQDYFDQGLTFVYGFNPEEGERSFRKAAALDPASPMPWWGVALALGPNYNEEMDPDNAAHAFEAVSRAEQLATHARSDEQAYVAALAHRFSSDAHADYKALGRAYAEAMKGLYASLPDDSDAAALYAESLMDLNAWKLWGADGKPADGTEEIVRLLEGVLQRDPNHVGANHYFIHALEASPHPERALPSARRLETLVPQLGHLVHMPGHIYARIGAFTDAMRSNADAAKADRLYAQKAGREGTTYDLMYRSHNEEALAFAACMAGRYTEARQAAEALASRLLPHANQMPMLDSFIMTPVWVEARFNKWPAVLARPEPAKNLPGTHALWRYARTLALMATGTAAAAALERSLFDAEVTAVPDALMLTDFNRAKDILAVAAAVLDARQAATRGDASQAISRWQAAAALQDALRYDEPPDWYYPVRESLGAALMSANKPVEAEKVFRDELSTSPRNPRSLFGLSQALKAQHREADAAWVEQQLGTVWTGGTPPLKLSDL